MGQKIDNLKLFNPKLIIGFGSKYTKIKKGINKNTDIDLIIVSEYFKDVSNLHRKSIIKNVLGNKYDILPLTVTEFKRIKRNKLSIVNLALNEGEVLFKDE